MDCNIEKSSARPLRLRGHSAMLRIYQAIMSNLWSIWTRLASFRQWSRSTLQQTCIEKGPESHGSRTTARMQETIVSGPQIVANTLAGFSNLVSLTLSETYDPDKPILIDASNSDRFVTLKSARELVASLVGSFETNSTVCLHLTNDVLYPVLVLAILASGCRWTGTNPAYTAPELEHHFRTSETNYVVTSPDHLGTVQAAVEAGGTHATIVLFEDLLEQPPKQEFVEAKGVIGLRSLLHPKSPQQLQSMLEAIPLDSIAALMQTSGTSGLPKIAARTHRAIMAELVAIEDDNAAKPYEVRRLFCTPIFHAFSAPEMLFNALRLGQTCYFMRRFDDTFAQKVHDLGITETFGPPPIMLKLLNDPDAPRLLQSLRLFAYGGAPLGQELRRKFLDLFKVKPRVVPVYGMTEGGWFTMLKYPEVDNDGSVGRPLPGYDVKVAPKGNAELHDGQLVGEILVRGPQIMNGYLGNPAATTGVFEDGWLRTGDIGYLKDGKVHLVDRAKDMIKVNAFAVAPTELENALMQSSLVLDAAVFGVGEGVDEHPIACIVRRNDLVCVDKIKAHLRTRLASYKVSKCEVRFVETIPRSGAGKILKKLLREQVGET